jgi:hypothetical protein
METQGFYCLYPSHHQSCYQKVLVALDIRYLLCTLTENGNQESGDSLRDREQDQLDFLRRSVLLSGNAVGHSARWTGIVIMDHLLRHTNTCYVNLFPRLTAVVGRM